MTKKEAIDRAIENIKLAIHGALEKATPMADYTAAQFVDAERFCKIAISLCKANSSRVADQRAGLTNGLTDDELALRADYVDYGGGGLVMGGGPPIALNVAHARQGIGGDTDMMRNIFMMAQDYLGKQGDARGATEDANELETLVRVIQELEEDHPSYERLDNRIGFLAAKIERRSHGQSEVVPADVLRGHPIGVGGSEEHEGGVRETDAPREDGTQLARFVGDQEGNAAS